MQFILGLIIWIFLGVVTWFVAHGITSIIGYDGMIVYVVSYAIAIAALLYITTKYFSNKEKHIIKIWSERGYKSAIAMLNNILPAEYRILSSEESFFEKIFNESINEAKKQHFDNNGQKTKTELLKNKDLWLVSILREYCREHCSWEVIEEGQVQMLNYVGEYSEANDYFDRIDYYDEYEFTPSGIIAEKIFLAHALLTEAPDSLLTRIPVYKDFIDKGSLSNLKRFEENDQI